MKILNLTYILLATMATEACSSEPPPVTDPLSPTVQTGVPTEKETLTMSDNMPSPSRPPPPKVEPIMYKNVRYEQDMESYRYGGDQPGGYLVAIDPETSKRLWMLKVYKVTVHDAAGVSTPGRYFRSMRLVPGRDEIEIENEVGGKYLVDLSKQTTTWISGPDSEHK
jgi:hypothetical protein